MSTHIPILFLHWLEDPTDHREAQPIAAAIADNINIRYVDTADRASALEAIRNWECNNDAAQCVFLGCHGDEDGIGDDAATGVDWPELGELFQSLSHRVVLWLFACHSSAAARAWSPITGTDPVSWIVGFPDGVSPSELQPVLERLIELTSIYNITHVDDELAEIRRAARQTRVTLHYPARLLDGSRAYVDVDEFEARVGLSFHDYLVREGCRDIGPILAEALATLAAQDTSDDP